MSKELAFTDDNDVVKYLDTTTAFNLALTADGVAFDLTNVKSILVKIANDDGYIMQETIDLTTVTSPLGGTLSFPINQDIMNTLVPDDYDIEVWVTMNDETQAIFPSDGTLGFSIEDNLMSDTGEVIPTITLNDFQQQFNDLSSQMANAVHNVQKGDKGDKGDTGTGLEIKDKVSSVSNLPSTANEGDGYLVGEELYVWVNGAWKDCGPLQGPKGDQGVQGIQGNTGTGVSSTTIQYQISNSATTAPTGTWSNDIVATTTANPYLWMKATLNYTDGTTKDFYLVSQKGDKGDTGATGATGPIGPQGPVGSGLVVKGTVNDASQLPTTGNQEGYCYFIGTDLYVWDAGTWKNCGNVSPDLSNYVTVTDLNNGLSTKVTDNKDGTEQLNGVQVQPFNKLSDSVGGRNLLINTAQLNDSTVCLDARSNTSETYFGLNIFQTASQWQGVRIYWSYLAPKLKTNTTYVMSEYVRNTSPTTSVKIGLYGNDLGVVFNSSVNYFVTTLPPNSGWTRISAPVNVASFPTTISGKLRFENVATLTDGYVQFAGLKLEQGSIATDWTPAPEDKVNVSDMRKPASDVAGIEEVNAKQDTIGYTPADDSTVVHTTDTSNWQKQKITNDDGSIIKRLTASNNDDLNKYLGNLAGGYTTFYVQGGVANNPSTQSARGFILKETSYYGGSGVGYLVDNFGSAWSIIISGSVTPIYTLLTSDSKVAHLSGANNFDTVPTVNNNPLLLASSLPSDLARTGSDQEFTGKNTFDTAPIDKTTGHPYITKDGVPAVPDTLADTTKDANFTGKLQKSGIDVATKSDITTAVNTATSNVVTTDKLANFTAGLQSGGVSVATSDDLKSVEDSAWRIMTGSSEAVDPYSCLYRINTDKERIEFVLWGNSVEFMSSDKLTVIDFSSIVTGISSVTGYLSISSTDEGGGYDLVSSGTKVLVDRCNYSKCQAFVVNSSNVNNQPAYAYYTGLK